jgi:hypothetical protein
MVLYKKYVLLDYEGKWKNDVFRMFFHITNELIQVHGYILIDTSLSTTRKLEDYLVKDTDNKLVSAESSAISTSSQKYEHHILVIENHDGKLLCDMFSDITELKNKGTKLYLLSDDIHKEKERKTTINYYDFFDKIFVTYYNPFFELYPHLDTPLLRQKVVWMPHCVSELMHVSFRDKPILQIGLLGNTVGKVYPNRAYVKELALKPEYKGLIAQKAHPAKKYLPVDYDKPTNLVGQRYFDMLNKFICNFTCSLLYGYAVCKYFEIAYTGSLLMCDSTHDDLAKLGFVDMENCVIYRNKTEIEDRIKWILNPSNREKVDKMRKAGYEMVRKKHTVTIRCKEINGHIS